MAGPSYTWGPQDVKTATVNFADPPNANPPPIPAYVWTTAAAGLDHRNYRERPDFPAVTSAAAPATAAAAAGSAASDPPAAPAAASSGARRRLGAVRGARGRPITGASTGFDGIGVPETRLIPADISVAVGSGFAVHTANSLVRFYRVGRNGLKVKASKADPADSATFLKQVWLPDFFYSVTQLGDGGNGCDEGVFAASAAYDKSVGRYLISAICGDYYNPRILLAVSSSNSVAGGWNLYSVPANNHVSSWKCPNWLRAYPDYSQIGYNRDGVYVSWVAICRDGLAPNQVQSSAMVYAFPKYAVYRRPGSGGFGPSLPGGGGGVYVPVFTGQDLCQNMRAQLTFNLPAGDDCGLAFTQLQPVAPQAAADVLAGTVYFVLDFYYNQPSRRNFVLAALIGTGALWDNSGQGTPAPYIVGRLVDRGQEAFIYEDVYLKQNTPTGSEAVAPSLDAGALNPRGYWNGGAAFSGGLVYVADRADVVDPPGTPDAEVYNPRPGVYWAWVQPGFSSYGRCAPNSGLNWGYGYGWDWSKGGYVPVPDAVKHALGDTTPSPATPPPPLAPSPLGSGVGPTSVGAGSGAGGQRRRMTAAGEAGGGGRSRRVGRALLGVSSSSSSSSSNGFNGTRHVSQRTPNLVYTTSDAEVMSKLSAQAPPGSRVTAPPPQEAAAAAIKPQSITQSQAQTAAAAAARAAGSWRAVSAAANTSGAEAPKWRDVFMSQAYYNQESSSWGVDFSCRLGTASWGQQTSVTMTAATVKSGVITYGSASGEAATPLGLAYPQVAVRGGTMLVTYTYGGYTTMPLTYGVTYPDAPAYPGVGFTLINPGTKFTAVNVARQQDPSFGPIMQNENRFGDCAGIDIHPISGKVWSANLYTWAPSTTVDGTAVASNAGARITIFG